MNVYINGKFKSTRLTGVQRVGREITSRLIPILNSRNINCEILEPPDWIAKSNLRSILSALWEQFVLPIKARNGLLLNFCNTAPVLYQNRQLVVLHDAAVFDMPSNFSTIYRYWARFQMNLLARGNSKLLTVSNFSRSRLADALDCVEDDFVILREGSNHILTIQPDERIIERLELKNKRFVLAVGSLQHGKNFSELLRAFNGVDESLTLVVAGGGDSIVFSTGVPLNGKRFIQAGYVSDSELRSLFDHALFFVQPSIYEGFGLPVIEAMALGTPVVCSSAASLPEICQNAAVYFNPYSTEDISNSINSLFNNEILQLQLVSYGYERASYYDWNISALELADLIVKYTIVN